MKLTPSIENYLKAVFQLSVEMEDDKVGTNQVADYLNLSPASVSTMIKKMRSQNLVDSQKYGKVKLTEKGYQAAVDLIRRHRLWETFLHEHLNFRWDEVHEVAHELEHIKSDKLIEELDNYLGNPTHDPHGHVIPSRDGKLTPISKKALADLEPGQKCRLKSIQDKSADFLKYVTQLGLALSSEIEVLDVRPFDSSILLGYDGKQESISHKVAENIFVELI